MREIGIIRLCRVMSSNFWNFGNSLLLRKVQRKDGQGGVVEMNNGVRKKKNVAWKEKKEKFAKVAF